MQTTFNPTINIQAAVTKQSAAIFIKGNFRVAPGADGVPEDPLKVLKHIVLVATRSGNYQALTPFKDVIVFADDVQVDGDMCFGNFNLNLMEHIKFGGEGEYHIHCSIGNVISNTERVLI